MNNGYPSFTTGDFFNAWQNDQRTNGTGHKTAPYRGSQIIDLTSMSDGACPSLPRPSERDSVIVSGFIELCEEDEVVLSGLKGRLLAREEQMQEVKRQIASLWCEISRVQESFEQRIRTEAEPAIGRAHEVEQSVAEVHREGSALRTASESSTERGIGELDFILQDEHFPVERLVAHQVCDGLAHRLHGNQLVVESNVTGDVLRLFISAIHGESSELTNETIDGRSALCDEFQLLSLSRRLDAFKKTPTDRSGRNTDRPARIGLSDSSSKRSRKECC
jgi:hypothetical protein